MLFVRELLRLSIDKPAWAENAGCPIIAPGTLALIVFAESSKSIVKRKNPHPNNLPPTEIDLVLRYAVNGFEAMDALSK